ncbi:hypothetical protein V6Z11_A10G167600 [Gossypium hirsutum]
MQSDSGLEKEQENGTSTETRKRGKFLDYRPWMVVERKNQQNPRSDILIRADIKGKGKLGSHFGASANMEGLEDLEKEHNKGAEGELAAFQGRLKAGDFVEEQRHKYRGSPNFNNSMRLGGDNLGC